MPKVEEDKPAPARKATKPSARAATTNVADRIAPLKRTSVGRLKVSFYGLPKTGKTRLGCTFPKPLLIIGTEDGTDSVVGTPGVDFVQLGNTAELVQLVQGTLMNGKYKTVMLDNATKFRDMRIDEIWAEKGVSVIPEKKPFLYADREWKEVWVQSSKELRNYLGLLLDLPRTIDLNVIVVAHEQNFAEEGGAVDHGDVIKPAIGSALGKSLCAWLNGECSYICQTFIRPQTKKKIIKLPGNKVRELEERTGKKEFCLRVGPHETFITGFRVPLGRPELPDVIVDPHYDKIVKIING